LKWPNRTIGNLISWSLGVAAIVLFMIQDRAAWCLPAAFVLLFLGVAYGAFENLFAPRKDR